ncbi:hypothetical protein N9X06_04135 [Paracoccaceae bacterium]|nr:hypothetical protein [Paracoccaceae bacterium]
MQIDDLTEAGIKKKINKILPVIVTAPPEDFINIVTFLGQNGTNFEDILELIDAYYKQIKDESLKLQLERILYRNFLKKYESEYCFNEFFSMVQKHCSLIPGRNSVKQRQKSIWFHVDAPVFLAHTNAMFKLLQSRDINSVPVYISSTEFNLDFEKKCSDLNVNYRVLSGKTDLERYQNLVSLSENALAVVWNGPPLHLSYISKRLDNVVYWSHRFHPRFDNVSLCLSGDPNLNDVFCHFDKKWRYFFSGFDIKNFGCSLNWKSRKNNFGSFCRETLIDNEQHWKNVAIILNSHSDVTYYYAGRKQIHDKYCTRLSIDENRIKWLGWLDYPEQEILKMAFILDGPILGHGLMGMEAMAGQVPMVSPYNSSGFFQNFCKYLKLNNVDQKLINKAFGLKFSSKQELILISQLLLRNDYNAKIGKIFNKMIIEREDTSGKFKTLVEIVEEGLCNTWG